MIDKEVKDHFREYEEQVRRWHLAIQNQVTAYRKSIDVLEERIIAESVLIYSYKNEAHKNLLRAEAAELRCKQLEAEKIKQISANKWANWSAEERKIIRV